MVPSKSDLWFARSIVNSLPSGRLWVAPGEMVFTIYHNAPPVGAPEDAPKTGRLVLEPSPCDDSGYDRIQSIFAAIGYAVHRKGEAEAIAANQSTVSG